MRIAVDARELAGQTTGVGRYLGEILREWSRLPEAASHEFVLCSPQPLTSDAGFQALPGTRVVAAGGGTAWEQLTLPRLAVDASADVLFCPGYTGPVLGRVPLVVAIHDVSFAAHPEWFRWREGLRRRLVTRAAARRAARVLTISEFSRREISEHLGVQASQIAVIYPGASAVASPSPPSAAWDTRATPLALYVGSIFNRRHVPETIEAFTRLAARAPDARLVVVGDNRTFPPIAIDTLAGDRSPVTIRPYVSDLALADLYRQARAFVFLSEYEGFGLTPLEALAAGVPIVVLDTPVAREVYGDAAIYVAELDPQAIEAGLEQGLFDETERARVLAAAPAVLARYSWTSCARGVLQVLLEAGAAPSGAGRAVEA